MNPMTSWCVHCPIGCMACYGLYSWISKEPPSINRHTTRGVNCGTPEAPRRHRYPMSDEELARLEELHQQGRRAEVQLRQELEDAGQDPKNLLTPMVLEEYATQEANG